MQIALSFAKRRATPVLASLAMLPALVLVTLIFELALAERKFALFGGGFGQSQTLDTGLEIAAFMLALVYCQGLLFYLLYRLFRRVAGTRADTPLFFFNFIFLLMLIWCGAIVAKYQALSYFSDAVSFQIVRGLGGGSLLDAALYAVSEAGLILIVGAGALIAWLAMRWFIARRWGDRKPVGDHIRLTTRNLIAALCLAPIVLFAMNRIDDSRAALSRLNSIYVHSVVFHQLTDFDRDGWSWFSSPIDLQPFDAARHPYALDIPGNGIDEDGFGGDLVRGEPMPPIVATIAEPRPHVILIVMESMRGDVIGQRINGQPVAPLMEEIARDGSYTRQAYSHVGFTSASLKSLFTGWVEPPSGARSLIDDFLDNGYQVGVFSGQSEDFGNTADVTGMRRGRFFVDAEDLREERAFSFAAQGSLYVDGRIVLREFDERLGDPELWTDPQFLYFNFQSAHFPYWAPGTDLILTDDPIARADISIANRDHVARTYWNAIAYNDRLLGELIDRLQRLGVYENSLIVITADHGESIFDDGFLGHGHMLNRQQTAIPLIVNRAGIDLSGPIGLSDMRRIILNAAGASVPDHRENDVFQFLGSLNRPGAIGRVNNSGEWTIFNINDETIAIGGRRPVRYHDLPSGAAERRQAEELIDHWARARLAARDFDPS